MNNLSKWTAVLTVCALVIGHMAGVFPWQHSGRAESPLPAEASKSKTPTESDVAAVELLRQARNRLFERQSVQAQMDQTVSIGEYKVKTTGSYLSASGFRFRLQYQLALGELVGEFLEVCDGQVLHTRRQILPANDSKADGITPEVEMTRRDIQRIRREALGIKDGNPTTDLADALRAAEVGLGGLPAILAMLERTLTLDPVRTQTVDQRDFLVLQGQLRADRKQELLTGLGSAGSQVGGFLPDVVRVYLQRDTLFPEKFLYLKRSNDKNEVVPLIIVEFKNVVLDQPVQDGQFVYMAPPGLEEKDETTLYLEMMRQAAAAALKKEEPNSKDQN